MIEVKNLSFTYEETQKPIYTLKDVSFNVLDHEWVSIIGHNGSGKSTLAKLLSGLIFSQKGEILIDGIEVNDQNEEKYRKKIGIVFQNPDNQFVGFNVKYDIAFGLENHQIEREKMIELIDEYTKKVGMNEYLSREPQTLSGGQKQRVAIAGILALDCDIIILDEATSMLDPSGTNEIIELIKELHTKYNKTIITITHDLNFAKLSDRIIVLRNGSIIKEGTPDEVFKERDILLSSNLDMPFSLRACYEASKNENINEGIKDLLWKYNSKM